ncbi:High-affinity branched-chain amino acid transport system permease protein LivH [compost metagenome]|jgi:branched-chain amino acid transport system permease protein|nr:branched-chain amino acid ABC transporter permease [Janthinobacterium sp. Marseille]ABR90093.1 Branched-chain amino acid ABC-type transport system, permease components [Janthinobacterium sp. Marseille]
MAPFFNILLAGIFQAAVLFLVASGLQLIFGVQRIINLACGSIYALGAYFGIFVTSWALSKGLPVHLFPFVLLGAGIVIGLIGIPLERLIRTIYNRPESFQLLLTFAVMLMFQDVLRFFWGADPQQLPNVSMTFGTMSAFGVSMPTYNVMVIAVAVTLAIGMAYFLGKTKTGKILRATAENRETSAAMGINVTRVYVMVFTLGTMLGTIGGALVIPNAAASLEMGVELVVEAFAVVVIGGLGSMKGAAVGALIVGLIRALSAMYYPEAEILAIYAIVLAVLIWKPAGLYGKAEA